MDRLKCFISAGCSFSQVPNYDTTWPVYLRDCIVPECVYYLGQGAAGNGIISKKTIYTVSKALQIYEPQEILVGIMWSGHDRANFYFDDLLMKHTELHGGENYCNPVRVAKDYKNYLVNFHWDDQLTRTYLKYFYNETASIIATLENILRTQWFLQSLHIPYFMTEYSYDCLPRDETYLDHDEIKYLYDMIDKSYWVPIDNMYKYAVDTGIPFPRQNDNHPGSVHHEKFVQEMLLPWLYRKYLHKYHTPA